MFINDPNDIPSSKITPPEAFFNRRNFLRAGVLAASALATGWVYRKFNNAPALSQRAVALPAGMKPLIIPTSRPAYIAPAIGADEMLTTFNNITHYNNFYEFSLDKDGVAPAADGFITRPWAVEVGGLCRKPKTFDLDDLLKISPPEERIYRMRCVEAWSMVIPWDGFSLSKLLEQVEPLSDAKFVAFQTLLDPKRMPNQGGSVLDWPYVEGLRMDEAMHPLTILASGIYGQPMPPQDGAPVRLVVPWKYGFKGIKSIVKIELRAAQPPTTWSAAAPNEYGFMANVNPNVDHPRWSQATEERIGVGRRDTLIFNGYADEVADLYAGMDLRQNF